jgi:hypothetical protein
MQLLLKPDLTPEGVIRYGYIVILQGIQFLEILFTEKIGQSGASPD